MRSWERRRGLLRAPKLAWDALCRGQYDFIYDRMPMRAAGMSFAKRLNLLKAGGNLVRRRLAPWSMPLHMQFELTNYCNLRCPVCPTGIRAISRPPTAMDPGLFSQVMDEVGPYLLTASLWAWGEPLLHPRLGEILRAARKHDVVTLLSTNGQNLGDSRVLEALTEDPPTCLIIAIDGLTDETNSRFRAGARLSPILEGVRQLAKLKKLKGMRLPVLHMRFIVMQHNEHELPQLEAFARSHGFELLTIRTLSIIDSQDPGRLHAPFVPGSHDFRAYTRPDSHRGFVCLEPFWFPTVFADGTLVSCEQDYNAQRPFGVISDEVSFADLWYSQRAVEVRRTVHDDPGSLSFCRNCPYSGRETTDCSVEARFLSPTAGLLRAVSSRTVDGAV